MKTGGRPETHPRRAIVDAILYVVRTGCSWRQLPTDFPPWQTVYWYFTGWENAKVTEKILAAVRTQLRVQEARHPEPSAGPVDSQTVKAADTVGAESRGYDAGKRINGRKRFLLTDTLGLLPLVMVRPAGVRDRAGASTMLPGLYLACRCRTVFADRGFAGWPVGWARRPLGIAVVGGLAFSQIITLYITPVIYTYFDALQQRLGRRKRSVPVRATAEPAEPAPTPAGAMARVREV